METSNVMLKTRTYLKDTGAVQVSDWEVLQGVGDALRILSEVSKNLKSPLFNNTKTINIAGGSVDLPADCLGIDRVFSSSGDELYRVFQTEPQDGEFRVRGDRIYSPESSITVAYFSCHETLEDPSSSIDIPDSFFAPLSRMAALIVSGDINGAIQLAVTTLGATPVQQQSGGE